MVCPLHNPKELVDFSHYMWSSLTLSKFLPSIKQAFYVEGF